MAELEANGLRIHYLAEGAGPPMVMLHGATSSAEEDWAAQRPAFRQGFRLYLPDARGHAGTRWDPGDGFSFEFLVRDLAAFVDALELQTFHLVGFSMGAITALGYALRRPERLRTLLLAGMDVQVQPQASVARRLMDADRVARDEQAWAAQLEARHGPVQGPLAWRRLLPALADALAAVPPPSPQALRTLRVPTLLAFGDRDVFVPVDHAVAFYRQLPDARLFIAPGCDHQVMVSRPGLFNEAARAFYRSTAAAAEARAAGRPEPTEAIARGTRRAPIPTSLDQIDQEA